MSKSIIIGANGYIGSNLAHYLITQNEEIFCYDIQPASFNNLHNYSQFDITNYESVSKLNLDVDFIYLFAGLTGTSQGFDSYETYIDINEKGLLHLLSRMKETGSTARIIFPSTRLVYKGKPGLALTENSEKEAKTIYALNKLACEYLLAMYKNAFDINYTIFRICVPYGSLIDSAFSYGTIGFFLQKALKKENIVLYGDGLLRRTFTNVADICKKIHRAIQAEETNGKIYNIGGENLSLLEVASLIAEKYGVNIEFAEWPAMTKKIESGDTIFDSALLDQLLNNDVPETFQQWLNSK